ncbi:hypothetical protein PGTUg99_026953 [Puccinia graminis f. sp. tritici]|uniref:TM7S3/TM198-like domain-containing protein n=1 Tax=Puccinia graminis f. sp. tritici TaxID=56615 RepID=A0A5B0Q1K5_PUCGR|nr:hypothetical protein PGTUg99_026953 [Puccinia graminis f. sp. tritici]
MMANNFHVFLILLVIAALGWLDPGAHQVSAQAVSQPEAPGTRPAPANNQPTPATGNTTPTTNSTLPQPGPAQQTNNNQTTLPAQNSTSTNTTTTLVNNNRNNALASTNSTSPSSSNSSSILNKDEAVPLDTKITVPFSILGALLIVSGAPMGFWGGRNRWSSYFLTGAFFGALIVMTPILRFGVIEQDRHPSTAIQGVFVLACLISAIAAGAVAVIFWKGTRFLVGAGGGFVISLFILSLKSNSLIQAAGLRWVLILAGSSIGFVLATIPLLTIHVTLFATAAMGAAAVVLGIDCFTTGGLKEFWLYIIGFGRMFPRLTYFPFTVTMQAELGVMGGLFLMGAAVQWRLLEVIRKKIEELKQLDQDRRMQEDAAAYRQSMALDADLALWEKRHGDDGDSATMAASPPKKHHGRKSSQFSLLPRHPGSPMSPQTPLTMCEHTSRPSNDHLLSLDVDGGLTGSLGITEVLPSPNLHTEHLSKPDTVGEAAETILPLYNTPHKPIGGQRPLSQADRTVSIDFEKFETDRRVSRPPGAPASWTSPIVGSSKPGASPRSKPSSPALNASRPMSYSPRIPELQELRPSNTHLRSTTEQPAVRPFSEHLSPLLNARHSEDVHRPAVNTRPASRVILGSYPAPSARPSQQPQTPHRESKVMTIEELDSRHKSAMRKLQQPMTDKVSAVAKPSTATQKTILHSRSAASLAQPAHNKEPRDHSRNSSFGPSTQAATRPLGRHGDASAPSLSPTTPASSQIPSANPSKSTNAWLSY